MNRKLLYRMWPRRNGRKIWATVYTPPRCGSFGTATVVVAHWLRLSNCGLAWSKWSKNDIISQSLSCSAMYRSPLSNCHQQVNTLNSTKSNEYLIAGTCNDDRGCVFTIHTVQWDQEDIVELTKKGNNDLALILSLTWKGLTCVLMVNAREMANKTENNWKREREADNEE